MLKQTILWTALPNGYSDDGRSLRISLLVSPRLETDTDQSLGRFPDFEDWPATLEQSHFVLTYGGSVPVKIAGNDLAGRTRVDNRVSLADSMVWKALFPKQTLVKGFEFRDLSNHAVLSYPAQEMEDLVRGLYTRLAESAVDQLPTATTFLRDAGWQRLLGVLQEHDFAFTDRETGIRRTREQFKAFKGGSFDSNSLPNNLARFQLFHTPPSKPRPRKDRVRDGDPKRPAEWLGYDQVLLPKPADLQNEFDFHRIVTAMNQYPTLLRKLGLVVDLLVSRDLFTPAAAALLSVEVELPPPTPEVERVPDASPRTNARLDPDRFQAVPRVMPAGQGGFRIVDGLLDLDAQTFGLLQADVDGAGLKVVNFARSLLMLEEEFDHAKDPVTKMEREMGAPSLRNAGLMLVHTKRGDLLEATIKRQNDFNTALPGHSKMSAQDLVRGYRIDIWDDVSKEWHSLCQREAIYDIDSGMVIIDVPEEEGTVRLAATTSRDKTSNPDIIWLHETLVSWAGWSLCAPAPGKSIHHQTTKPDPDDPNKEIVVHEDPVGEPEAEVPPGLRLRSAFKALPGTLPRLRYGRSYWLRARAVDLAGNSLDPQSNDFGPEKPQTNARPYLRFDPISAPALALVKPTPATTEKPAEGESMERMAVRSLNDTPNLNTVPTTQRTRRLAVPSRTSQREAEQHGMLDRGGVVDPTFFSMLVAQDNSLANETIDTAGPLVVGSSVKTQYAVMVDGDPLPYLPDPLAVEIAARIFDHPDFPADKIIPIPFYDGTEWPEALPFKIEIYEDPLDAPHYDDAVRTLFIPLPKAARATLRLSVRPTAATLKLLGIWSWLTPAQQQKTVVVNGQSMTLEKLARRGQHWMLTPWRNVELVHAVQRPLITPQLQKLSIDRRENQTFARPVFSAPCSIASTDRVDLRANWNEPFDDTGNGPGYYARVDHAFSVKITDPKFYKGDLEYVSVGTDAIAVNQGPISPPRQPEHVLPGVKFHEFHDPRYRRIEYWLEATTNFREFMSASLLLDKKKQPTEENIRVVGPKVRTWVPASAPPPAPEVLYVVPTFGWVRSGDETSRQSWRRGGGLRVYLNRPWNASGYGEMLAVVLPRASFSGDPEKDPPARPLKNFVTQWGNDPIWLSPFVPGLAPKLSNFPLARTEPDPDGKWLPKLTPPEEADQPPGTFRITALEHPDFINAPAEAKVDIAPHDVFYDEERQLWYCDIEVTWGKAYFPFIRLALARFQPVALEPAHLSNVVLADFMQLVPDRWLNVTHTNDPRTRQVRVFGNSYSDSSSHMEVEDMPGPLQVEPPEVAKSSVIEVWVERLEPGLGEDFGWVRETQAIVLNFAAQALPRGRGAAEVRVTERLIQRDKIRATDLLRHREFEALIEEDLIGQVFFNPVLWEGNVTLPGTTGGETRYRLAIAEYEEYLVDNPGVPEKTYDPSLKTKGRRLVFIEHVELA